MCNIVSNNIGIKLIELNTTTTPDCVKKSIDFLRTTENFKKEGFDFTSIDGINTFPQIIEALKTELAATVKAIEDSGKEKSGPSLGSTISLGFITKISNIINNCCCISGTQSNSNNSPLN